MSRRVGEGTGLSAVIDVLQHSESLGIALVDTHFRFTGVNRTVAELHDLPAEDHVGRALAEVNPQLAAVLDPLLRRVVDSGEPLLDIDFQVGVPGRERQYNALACIHPLLEDERVRGLALVWWDVTGRADEEVLEGDAERRFRSMADAAPVMIWLAAADGRCTWVNQAWRDWTGRSVEEEVGEGWLEGVHPDDRARLRRMGLAASQRINPSESVYRLQRADGSYGWVLQRVVPRRSHDGESAGFFGTNTDITELKELQTSVIHTKNRLERVQRLTASLSRASTGADVLGSMLDHALVAVGGSAGMAALIDPDSARLRVVDARGYPPEAVARLQDVSLDADLPLAVVARTGERVEYGSTAELLATHPLLAELAPPDADVAVTVLPIAMRSGIAGAFKVMFRDRSALREDTLDLLDTMVEQCAQALERATLYEREAEARETAEQAGHWIEFLARASELLSSSLDLNETLQAVARVSVPELADGCLVHLRDAGDPVLVALEHRDPETTRELRARARNWEIDHRAAAGVGLTLGTGRVQLFTDMGGEPVEAMTGRRLDADTPDDPVLRDLRDVGALTIAIVPIADPEGVRGTMTFVCEPGRGFGEEELRWAHELARRTGTAVTNAMAYRERSETAQALQRSLLPPSLPEIPGVSLAARHVSAGEGLEVGGDFYDAFPAPGGRWVLAIGDVRGRGVRAAGTTGIARTTLRSAARQDASPQYLLEHLNAILLQAEVERTDEGLLVPRFCTVVVAVLERTETGARVTVASAGHPLPLLVTPDGASREVGRPGSLLGVLEEAEFAEVEEVLAEGDALVLLTDGILERRDGESFFEDVLGAVLRDSPGRSAEDVAGRLETEARAFGGTVPVDDMAILVARIEET